MKKSFIGSAVAFIIGSACCWVPVIAVMVGGVSGAAAITNGLEKLSGLFLGISVLLLGFGIYQLRKRKLKQGEMKEAILQSIIKCPNCNHEKAETMPTDSCQFYYECEKCKSILKPKGTPPTEPDAVAHRQVQ